MAYFREAQRLVSRSEHAVGSGEPLRHGIECDGASRWEDVAAKEMRWRWSSSNEHGNHQTSAVSRFPSQDDAPTHAHLAASTTKWHSNVALSRRLTLPAISLKDTLRLCVHARTVCLCHTAHCSPPKSRHPILWCSRSRLSRKWVPKPPQRERQKHRASRTTTPPHLAVVRQAGGVG